MIYIIGGAPRSGKTAAARSFCRLTGIPFFSLDLLMMGFIYGLPELGVRSEADEMVIADQLWPVVQGMVWTVDEDRQDYLFEGTQLRPAEVSALYPASQGRLRACFLGYADIDPQAKLRQIRQYGGGLEDWLREFDDAWVLAEVSRLVTQSRWLRDECLRLGLRYIETGLDLSETVAEVTRYLLEGIA